MSGQAQAPTWASSATEVLGESRPVLGGAFGMETAEESAARMRDFVEAGGTLVETGYSYVGGRAMAAVGEWLEANPGQLKVVMKIGHGARGVDIPLTKANILHDLMDSLSVLHVDSLGVALLHCDDESLPVDEIADTLVGIVEDGLAESVGVSNWKAPRLDLLASNLIARGHLPLSSYHFSLAAVDPELQHGSSMAADDDVLTVIERHQLPLLCWSANAGGYFARHDDGIAGDEPDMFDTALSRERRARCIELGARLGVQPATVALAWTLSHDRTWASVGPATPEQRAQAFAAAELTLTPEDRAWLRDGQ